MSVLRAVIAAFSCYSAIPMPHVRWDERDMRYMMAAFPLVGLVIGALDLLWPWLCGAMGAGTLLRAVGFTLIPVLVSGGIHLDGLADVTDAQSSHAEPERRRQILKDPHVGAFAVIGVCCYLLAYAGLASELDARTVTLFVCVPVASRCLSGLAVVILPAARREGMYASVGEAANKRVVRIALAVELALACACMVALQPIVALCALVVAAATLAYVRHLANSQYGGMSGDLAGFFLQLCELGMLACIVVTGRLV